MTQAIAEQSMWLSACLSSSIPVTSWSNVHHSSNQDLKSSLYGARCSSRVVFISQDVHHKLKAVFSCVEDCHVII